MPSSTTRTRRRPSPGVLSVRPPGAVQLGGLLPERPPGAGRTGPGEGRETAEGALRRPPLGRPEARDRPHRQAFQRTSPLSCAPPLTPSARRIRAARAARCEGLSLRYSVRLSADYDTACYSVRHTANSTSCRSYAVRSREHELRHSRRRLRRLKPLVSPAWACSPDRQGASAPCCCGPEPRRDFVRNRAAGPLVERGEGNGNQPVGSRGPGESPQKGD